MSQLVLSRVKQLTYPVDSNNVPTRANLTYKLDLWVLSSDVAACCLICSLFFVIIVDVSQFEVSLPLDSLPVESVHSSITSNERASVQGVPPDQSGTNLIYRDVDEQLHSSSKVLSYYYYYYHLIVHRDRIMSSNNGTGG